MEPGLPAGLLFVFDVVHSLIPYWWTDSATRVDSSPNDDDFCSS
jgi:hypothetical protein